MQTKEPRPDDNANEGARVAVEVVSSNTPRLHFGRLLLVCAVAAVFCGVLVWFATTYLRNCCAP
jgi:hypothetical protein